MGCEHMIGLCLLRKAWRRLTWCSNLRDIYFLGFSFGSSSLLELAILMYIFVLFFVLRYSLRR